MPRDGRDASGDHPLFGPSADDLSSPTEPTRTQTLAVESHTMLRVRRARLEVAAGPDRGRKLLTEKDPITIGTHRFSDLRLEDKTVSRRHAELAITERGYLVTDVGSRNGTFIDGHRVERAYLAPGSELRIGANTIVVRALDEQIEVHAAADVELGAMVGHGIRMRAMFGLIRKVAPLEATVLVTGETGTGKELVATAIHELSPRAKAPLVVVDCGAIPANLIESELFGHERGAFTGAATARQGAFERADGGTVFLDEIGELRLDLQPRLLRALEQRVVQRVGSSQPRRLDFRIVAATNRDLGKEVLAGRFRNDLFFRLSVIHLVLPPLRERREDIPFIVKKVLSNAAGSGERSRTVTEAAMSRLVTYDWPGNVRELVNVVHQMSALSEGARLGVESLPARLAIDPRLPTPSGMADAMSFKDAREEVLAAFERDYLASLLRRCKGNISEAARQCGLHRKTVERLVQRYGLDAHALGREAEKPAK